MSRSGAAALVRRQPLNADCFAQRAQALADGGGRHALPIQPATLAAAAQEGTQRRRSLVSGAPWYREGGKGKSLWRPQNKQLVAKARTVWLSGSWSQLETQWGNA